MTMTSEERDRFKKELDSLWDSSEKPVPKSPAITRAAIENLTAPLGQTEERADAIPDPFAGTFADMFALADSPGQREILKKLIQERQQEDPEGFSKLFSGSRASAHSGDFHHQLLSPEGQAAAAASSEANSWLTGTPLEFLVPRFGAEGSLFKTEEERDAFVAAAGGPTATRLEEQRRRKAFKQTGAFKEGKLELDENPLTTGQIFDLKRAASDEERLSLLQKFFGRNAFMESVQVGVTPEGDPIVERLFSRGANDKLYRMEPYGSFTGIKNFLSDWGRRDVDKAAAARVDAFTKDVLVTAADEVTSLETLLPMLAIALGPGAGVPVLGQVAIAGARGIGAGGLNVIGQMADRAISGLDQFKMNAIDYGSAVFDTLLTGLGPIAKDTFDWMAGDQSPFSKAYDRAGAKIILPLLESLERLGVKDPEVPRAVLLNTGLARAFVDQIFAMDPPRARRAITPLTKEIYQGLKRSADKVERLTNADISLDDMTGLVQEGENRARAWIQANGFLPEGTFAENAKKALEPLQNIFSNIRAVTDASYAKALNSPPVLKAMYDNMNVDPLRKAALSAETKIRVDAGLPEGAPIDEVPLQKQLAALFGEDVVGEVFEDAASRGLTINPPGANILNILDRIKQLETGITFRGATENEAKEKASVMSQLHALKQTLNEASDTFKGSDSPYITTLQKEVDSLIDKAGEAVLVSGDKTAKEYYDFATPSARRLGVLKRAEYFSEALDRGDTSPADAFLRPFFNGDEFVTSDLILTMNELLQKNWTTMVQTQELKKFFPRKNYVSFEQAQNDFRKALKDSSILYLTRDPASAPQRLKDLTGVRSLSELSRMMDDETLAFMMPNRKERSDFIRAVARQEKFDLEQDILREAYDDVEGISPNSTNMSRAVMSALVNRIRKSAETREGQAKLPLTDGKIEKIFDSLGAQKAVPQLQRFMVEKILNDLKKGDVDDFAVRLDLFDEAKPGASNFALGPLDDKIANYILSQRGSGIDEISDIRQIVRDIVKVSSVLNGFEAGDFAAGLARGGYASKLLGEKTFKGLVDFVYRNLENKALISSLLRPTSRKQIERAIDDASPLSKSQRTRIIGQVLFREHNRLSQEPEYGLDSDGITFGLINVKSPKNLPPRIRSETMKRIQREVKGEQGGFLSPGDAMNLFKGKQGSLRNVPSVTTPVLPFNRDTSPQTIPQTERAPLNLASQTIPPQMPSSSMQGGLGSLDALRNVGMPLFEPQLG